MMVKLWSRSILFTLLARYFIAGLSGQEMGWIMVHLQYSPILRQLQYLDRDYKVLLSGLTFMCEPLSISVGMARGQVIVRVVVVVVVF